MTWTPDMATRARAVLEDWDDDGLCAVLADALDEIDRLNTLGRCDHLLNNTAADAIARLEAERDRLVARVAELEKQVHDHERARGVLASERFIERGVHTDRIAALESVLRKYGEHRWKCSISRAIRDATRPVPAGTVCDCGWREECAALGGEP